MIKVAIFASGSGSNAENISKYFEDNKDIRIELIVSNKPDAFVHQRARLLGIPSVTFSKSDFDSGEKVLDVLREKQVDFIVLAGFLLKVSPSILQAYPDCIVNIHPALLPKFGGRGMYGDRVHQAVVAAREKETGITIHYVNENYDEGDTIFQAKVEVAENDSPEKVAEKVHQLEYQYFPSIIEKVLYLRMNQLH